MTICLILVALAFGFGTAFGVVLGRQSPQKPAPEPQRKWDLTASDPLKGTAGWAIVAALNGVGCLGRSRQDEPVFVLCARDLAAPWAISAWGEEATRLGAKRDKVQDALEVASRMERWRERNGGGKVPD